MLLVDTYIAPSKIHGIGLFAGADISKGTPIWKFNQNTCQIYWRKQFINICWDLSLPAILDLLNHSYLKEGNIYYLNDNTKFINHSLTPNIAFQTTTLEVAIEDIKKDEEITENYSISYDQNDFFDLKLASYNGSKKLLIKYLSEQILIKSRPKQSFLVR